MNLLIITIHYQDDLRSIIENNPNDNVVQRQEVHRILNEAMEEALINVADRNAQIINGANEGRYTPFSAQDVQNEIFQMKQEMLEKLWEAQHQEEQDRQDGQVEAQESENADVEQNGEQIVEDVVEQSKEIEIRADEISEVNREINQVERDFIQAEQQPQQDMGMSMGE